MSKLDVKDKFLTLECKKCLKKIHFRISAETISDGKFPLKLEDTHGSPPHKIIFTVNKKLEMESFEIEEVLIKKKVVTSKFTKEILKEYGLEDKEIDLFIKCLGLGPVTIGEMSRMVDLPPEKIEEISKKFVERGFFREIIGARQYYQSLPPYPALIWQLNDFADFISKIKVETPINLQESFKKFEAQAQGVKRLTEFKDYLSNLNNIIAENIKKEKQNLDNTISLLDQRENIEKIEKLQHDAVNLIETQFSSLNLQLVSSISKFDELFSILEQNIDNSVQKFDKKIDQITESLNELKIKLSKNFGKLRLGIIQKVVEDVLNKTFLSEIINIKRTFKNELNKELNNLLSNLKESFTKQLKDPLQSIVNNSKQIFEKELQEPFKNLVVEVAQKIKDSTQNASKIGEDLKSTFNNIITEFNNTIKDSQTRITGISEEILSSFASLRTTFSNTVISELDNMLEKVKNRLDLSSLTVEEFWEGAKTMESQSMKDVWFIRTPEGMISQINEEVRNAKMRILIVAPTLKDIEIEPLLNIKPQINIRICCYINIEDPNHKKILDKLEKRTNISLRNRLLQNLWGINRDYEEIILGIVSKSETEDTLELVGLGSNLSEHIKILVPILEEAWMGSKKEYHIPQKPIIETKKALSSEIIKEIEEKIGKTPEIISESKQEVLIPESTVTSKSLVKTTAETETLISKPPIEQEIKIQTTMQTQAPSISDETTKKITQVTVSDDIINSIILKINNLKEIINTEQPTKFSEKLLELKEYIFEKKGFLKILNDIQNWSSQIKSKNSIDEKSKNMLLKRMDYWIEFIQK